jgi:hypothetical protein
MRDKQKLRVAVAKALRGEGWPLAWSEVSAARRRSWLEMADIALNAIEQEEAEMESWLIPDARKCWKLLSVQIHALMGLWLTLFEVMPVLSPQIAAVLPDPLQAKVIAAYAIAGVLSRVIAQRGK